MIRKIALFLSLAASIGYASQINAQACAGPLSVTVAGSTTGVPLSASAAVTSNYNGSQVSCAVGQGTSNDGVITVTASGGTQIAGPNPYLYSLNAGPDQTSNVFSGLTAAGSPYVVTVKDANNCTKMTASVTITAPPAIQAGTCNLVDDECQVDAGSITVDATGGTGALNVTWTAVANAPFTGTPGGSPAGNVPTLVPANYTGLSGNSTYSFTVTDANGCQIP
jgi:hypothetical protein